MEKYNKSKIEALDKFVKGINFSLVKDKDVRNTFVRLIPQTARRLKEIEEDKKALFEKFIEPFPEEKRIAYDKANSERLALLRKFQETGSEEDKKAFEDKHTAFSKDFADLIVAVDEFNRSVAAIMSEDTDLSVDAIDIMKFMDAMEGQAFDVTADTFEMLNPIVRFCEPDVANPQ